MKLVIASNNKGKIAEIKAILSPYFEEILSQHEAGMILEVEESGQTFLENALLKAHAAVQICGCAALSDDSGLCVDALNGAPGVYSARYAGEQRDDRDNLSLLIQNLSEIPSPRNAHFTSAVALCYPDGTAITAQGSVEGEIILTPMGTDGFGYDPIFYYPPLQKTFAQLTFAQKNEVSHRKRALEALREQLEAGKHT